MEAHYLEFLSMLVRWLHIIAGVAWIGSSFYFIWLDNSLDAPAPGSDAAKKGVGGELWAVHGGGFYNPQKYLVAPAALPEKLHWFKWEAYTTWLSGTALLVLVYWMKAAVMMVDPGIASLTPGQAVALGAGSMVGSWVVYDLLCRSPLGKYEGLLGAVVFGLITLLAWGLGRTLGGRAMFIHVGTAIGTIMAANVFFIIIPGQKRMVTAMRAGQAPLGRDHQCADLARRRRVCRMDLGGIEGGVVDDGNSCRNHGHGVRPFVVRVVDPSAGVPGRADVRRVRTGDERARARL